MLNSLTDFKNAIERLEQVLQLEETDVIRDSAIKRFELCFELMWKTLRFVLREEGLNCYSPRSCIKTAFQAGLINYSEDWLKMIDDRNLTAHVYKEKYAREVYNRLPIYLNLFKQLVENLNERKR